MQICTFWYGKKLRYIDEICLKSMVKAGYNVDLYAYEAPENMPAGVSVRDAGEILPLDIMNRLEPQFPHLRSGSTIAQFSDIFRVHLMKYGRGVWFDTDVYVFKTQAFDPGQPFFARENRERLGVSVLYLKPDDPIVGAFEAYLAEGHFIPPWLGLRRRVLRPLLYRLAGKEVCLWDVGITVFGNDGITRLAKKYGTFDQAADPDTYYALIGRDTEKLFAPDYDWRWLVDGDSFGIHVHRKKPAAGKPAPGSFFHWAVERLDGL